MDTARDRRSLAIALGAVAALVLLVYGRTLGADWAWAFDDARFIVKNDRVLHPSSWLGFLTDPRTTDPKSPTGIVRPLRTLEFALDHALFGLSPAAFRAHSLLWFLAGTSMVLLLLRELLGDLRAAAFGAALWALHPIQTEAVAWISSRGDVAMGACVAGSLWTSLRSRGLDRWFVASLVLAGVATLYKETAVVVPLLIAALRVVRRPEGPGAARAALGAWPWLVVGAAYWFLYRRAVQVGDTAHVHTFVLGGSTEGTFATMARAFGAYVGFALLPVRPVVDWFLPVSTSFADPSALAWAAFHVAAVALAVRAALRRSLLGFAVLAFYLPLGPVSNWPFAIGIPTAERFLHLPLSGLALLAALGFQGARRASPTVALPAALLLVCAGTISFLRTADWKDDTTLFPPAARFGSTPRAASYMAAELRKEGFRRRSEARTLPEGPQRDAALAEADATLRRALDFAHESIRLWHAAEHVERSVSHVVIEPHVNAANIAYLLGDHDETIRHAEEAIRIGEDLFPQAHYNRALALLALGRGAAAIRSLDRALELWMPGGGPTDPAEFVGLFERAALACAAVGWDECVLLAQRRAAAVAEPKSPDEAARRRREADEYETHLLEDPEPDLQGRWSRAVRRALAGRLEAADAIRAELVASGAFPPDREATWIEARWEARGSPDGWREALRRYVEVPGPDANAILGAARCAEELGLDDLALRGFEEFLRLAAPSEGDPRRLRAERSVRRLRGSCPALPKAALPSGPRGE